MGVITRAWPSKTHAEQSQLIWGKKVGDTLCTLRCEAAQLCARNMHQQHEEVPG
eukprot:m.978496 g.978496  ORF g.978496 m.978496 type:complete len:54 (-) comp23959_c0_seq1:97-258(-)